VGCGLRRPSRGAAAALALVAVAGLVVSEPARAKARQYDVSPAAHWVQPITVEAAGDLPQNEKDGTQYLLVDRQFRIQNGWSEYQRYVSRVVNPAGVEDASQLTIDFDPQLDHLILHAVQVRRGAQVIDELRHGRISVLQRESELEQGILDGSLTFHLLMSDVRVGDIIDLSYTIEHHDSALGNRFFGWELTRWDDPLARSHLRVLIPEASPLSVGGTETSAPVKSRTSGWQTLEWDWKALPGMVADEDAPSWYQQHPVIQFSQFTSWGEVVRTALPLYSFNARDPELEEVSAHLKSSARTQSERGLAAVRFVQEKIRYTGLELGSGAFRPRPPAEVLRSRYGDCKDKALLAVALLRAMGMDAAPALVSTRWQGHLDQQLPSPGDFDHAIVRLRMAGKTWIDVTETAQGGVLETLDQADFGKALVVSPGVTALESIPRTVPAQPLVTASAVFDLRAGLNAEGSYSISTVYRGSEANGMRRRLRRTSAADLGDTYLNYYKGRYPGARAVRPPVIHDDPVANEITVNEAYRIAHPFESLDSGRRRFDLTAEVIDDYAPPVRHPSRKAPLSLDYPANVAEQILIRLPTDFPVEDDNVKIDNAAFHYDSQLTHDGNDVRFEAHYRTLTDEVPRDRLNRFINQLDDVRHDDSLVLTSKSVAAYRRTPSDEIVAKAAALAKSKHAADAGTSVSMPAILTLAASLLFGVWCGWRVFRYDPAPEEAEKNAPTGIRGFLLLPAVGVTLAPIGSLVTLTAWVKIGELRVWDMLPWISSTSYQPWHYYAYLLLLAAMCLQVIGCSIVTILFFMKRSSAPEVLVALIWLGLPLSFGLELFYASLGIHDHTFARLAAFAFAQVFSAWGYSLYLYKSQRVKATFIARRREKTVVSSPVSQSLPEHGPS
jgi:transglutaminase-like putative cysteine protease